jgi:hypothetical protein
MATTTKTERIAQGVIDLLDYKYGSGASTKKYDTNSDVYISLAVGGTVKALVKFEPVAVEANNATNPITQAAGRSFVPDLCRVGFDLGNKAIGTVVTTATPAYTLASAELTGLAILDTNTIIINGVTFTAVGAAPANNQFLSGPGAGSDADSMADLVRAINASTTAAINTKFFAVQNAGAPTKVNLYRKDIGTAGNSLVITEGAAATITVTGGAGGPPKTKTCANGGDGEYVTIGTTHFYPVELPTGVSLTNLNAPANSVLWSLPSGATDAANAISLAAKITATPLCGVSAVVNGVLTNEVDLTALVPGLAGNLIPVTASGASYTIGAMGGGLDGVVDAATQAYIASTVALTGVEVFFYSKTGILITDLVAATVPFQTFRNEWGYINQQ